MENGQVDGHHSAMGRRTGPTVLLIVGIFLCLGPLWGLLVTTIGMLRTFNEVAGSKSVPPEAVAANIHFAVWATAAGLLALPFGIGTVIAGVVWRRRNKQ